MRSVVVAGSLAVATVMVGPLSRANAAALRVEAADDCMNASELGEQVDVLLGRPLAAVPDIDFHLAISRAGPRRWSLRLDTIDRNATVARRELSGGSCAELEQVAAVAVTMAVRALSPESGASASGDASHSPAATAAGTPSAPGAPANPTPPAASLAALSNGAAREGQSATATSASAPWSAGVGLLAVGNAGTFPNLGIGAALEGTLAYHRFTGVARGGILASQTAGTAAVQGGEFQFAFAALLGCWSHSLRKLGLTACVGAEVGRLAARGSGADIRPETRATLWQAGLAAAGAEVPLTAGLALILRAELAVPLTRPSFVLDQQTFVHRPAALGARVMVGLKIPL